MGIDLLDIRYSIEKELNVEISDDDFMSIARDHDIAVGDLYDLLLSKLHLRDVARNDVYLNYRFWTDFRQILHSATDVPLDRIELATCLEELFPQAMCRERWNALRAVCPYRVRELDYPTTVRVVGFLLATGVVLIEQFHLWQLPALQWIWPALGLLGFWMVTETYLKILTICAPLRSRLPSGMTTVKDLSRTVLASNYIEVCQDMAISLDERCLAVWQKLIGVLVEVLQIDSDKISFRSRLMRDLGMS